MSATRHDPTRDTRRGGMIAAPTIAIPSTSATTDMLTGEMLAFGAALHRPQADATAQLTG